MSVPAPFACVWDGHVFRPLPRHHNTVAAAFGEGEITTLAVQEERSEVSHRHEFAWLREVWRTLPDHLAADYPSPDHLRKRALIATGWCDVKDYPCETKAEAQRLARTLRGELDDYTVIIQRDAVVRVCRAKSQARGKMLKADFQASKDDVLRWVSDLIGADPQQVQRARAA